MPRPPARAQAVAALLASAITGGTYPAEAWLPSERELADEHQADRSTVRRALRMLQAQGLIVIHPNTGAQVRGRAGAVLQRRTGDVTRQAGSWRGFHLSAMEAGKQPYTRTHVEEQLADAEVARWLGVPAGTSVVKRARVQGIIDGPPIQTSTSWIPAGTIEGFPILSQVDTGPGGMYSRFEDAGLSLTFEDMVSCRLPDGSEQETLQTGPGQPVLAVWRRCYDQSGRILEVTSRVIAGDRQQLIYRYS